MDELERLNILANTLESIAEELKQFNTEHSTKEISPLEKRVERLERFCNI